MDASIENLDTSCDKLVGSLIIKGDAAVELNLQEITGELKVLKHLPSLKRPLKVSKLILEPTDFKDYNLSQITADEIQVGTRVRGKVIFDPEPAALILYPSGSITFSGITGTRLKRVEILGYNARVVGFREVKHLDYLEIRENEAFEDFFSLESANSVHIESTTSRVQLNIQKVGTLLIEAKSGFMNKPTISLENLAHVDDYIKVKGNPESFHAPKLTWGRLDFETEPTTLELNKDLEWAGKAVFKSKNFCQKYFHHFLVRSVDFDTPDNCNFKCPQTYDSTSINSLRFCKNLNAIQITKHSPKSIYLDNANTLTGDLIIDNHNGSFSAQSLTKITGNVHIVNCGSFSAPNLTEIEGSLTITNSSYISLFKLERILGDLKLTDSNFPTKQTLYNLKHVNKVYLQQQKSSLEFKALKYIHSLSIRPKLLNQHHWDPGH
ncbi:hypothetical protein DSO57_1005175 [Entomophthora muscae]|uniref:Uncharacterized protein n=1 Tax=Entomophthora muscae TaxID=34485 RepID=A0ACC2TV29_9FUNG|nr:hypothetical protein DSO57_1005175 [Entomophthora muscae]